MKKSRNKMLGGVCGGIAEHLDIDVTLVRIAFLALCWMYGASIVAYGILWLVMDE